VVVSNTPRTASALRRAESPRKEGVARRLTRKSVFGSRPDAAATARPASVGWFNALDH